MEFSDWLVRELEQRGWSNSELARRAGVVPSTISMVISGHQKPGVDLCNGIARAFNMPPVAVFRLAGILPRVSRKEELIEEFLFFWDQLPEPQQRNLMRVAWAMALAREAGGPVTIDVEAPGIPDSSVAVDS